MSIAIDVKHLTRRFGQFVAVNDVSFAVQKGEIFGFLGSNGAGKSTTIRMLCGLPRPTSGTAIVGGIDVAADPEGVKRRIGYMKVTRVSTMEGATIAPADRSVFPSDLRGSVSSTVPIEVVKNFTSR